MPSKSRRCLRAREFQFSCTAYDELLEVMDHKIIFLAINPQLERVPFLPKSPCGGLRRSGKSIFSRIHSFLTLRGCVKMAMRGCPLCKRKLPPCHLSRRIWLKWQGICSSRSDRRFVANYGGASGIPD